MNELSTIIVDKIFEISGSVLLRKTFRLPPLLSELMTGYDMTNLNKSQIYDYCRDIPVQIVQHMMQCCIGHNYLYIKKSFDANGAQRRCGIRIYSQLSISLLSDDIN